MLVDGRPLSGVDFLRQLDVSAFTPEVASVALT
jgi:hypothetical protein